VTRRRPHPGGGNARRLAAALARDRGGMAIVEFAIICPVMLILIMGLGDLTYQTYVQSVLTGAVQKAGRDSTIQGAGAQTSQIDSVVMQQVWQIAKNATYDSKRASFSTFSAVGPEPFEDTAGTGAYVQAKYCFTDVNGNKAWDADPGVSGQGGANDVTVYTIHVYYQRLFPVATMIGLAPNVTLTGTTTLKNQPWATQNAYTPTRVCPS
jgi:Flp pilus assembly protein TadG